MAHLLADATVHHAVTQAVKVVSMPHDPLEAQSLKVAQDTYNATVFALQVALGAFILGFAALVIALVDARNNSRQLRIALARARFVIDANVKKDKYGAHRDYKVGEKASQSYLLTVYSPLSVCSDAATYTGEREAIDGIEYKLTRFREYAENVYKGQIGGRPVNGLRDIVLFPNGTGIGFPFVLNLHADVKSVTFRWRMHSEDAVSPESNYGTITLDVA
jgi:hypothetical protein